MHTRSTIPFLLALLLGLSAFPVQAQGWDTYESEVFDLQFALPAGWVDE